MIDDLKIKLLESKLKRTFDMAYGAVSADKDFAVSNPFTIDANEIINECDFTFDDIRHFTNQIVKLWASWSEPRFYNVEFDQKASMITVRCTKSWGPVSFAQLLGTMDTSVKDDEIVAVLDFVKRLIFEPEIFLQHHGAKYKNLLSGGACVGKSVLKRRFYARFGNSRFERIYQYMIAIGCFVEVDSTWRAANSVKAEFVKVDGIKCSTFYNP